MSVKDNNVDKILITYVKPVSVKYCKHLILNSSLFNEDGCDICGRCCGPWDPVFLPFEVDYMKKILSDECELNTVEHLGASISNIQELVNSLKPITVEVEGKEKLLYKSHLSPTEHTFNDRGTLRRCHWCIPVGDDKMGCAIHQVESLTCRFPHIRLNYNSQRLSTHIGLIQFGRNWALKCPVEFNEKFSISTVNKVIGKFQLLQKYCEYFEVDNYCKNIIDLLKVVKEPKDVQKVCGYDILLDNNKGDLF